MFSITYLEFQNYVTNVRDREDKKIIMAMPERKTERKIDNIFQIFSQLSF